MSDEIEAIGAAVEGGLVAKAVDDEGKLVRAEGEVSGAPFHWRAVARHSAWCITF